MDNGQVIPGQSEGFDMVGVDEWLSLKCEVTEVERVLAGVADDIKPRVVQRGSSTDRLRSG